MIQAAMKEKIEGLLQQHPVVVFMKGTRDIPMCGFSATVVDLLDAYHVDYQAVNVLDDPEMRQAIKDFSSWPTIPQIYIKGEFIGGADIAKAMDEADEFAPLFKKHGIAFEA
jgi:monothiol glutaredoxin